jgi:hypothetical protein
MGVFRRWARWAGLVSLSLGLVACGGSGGGGDAAPGDPPPAARAPAITVQPADQDVTAGDGARFTVVAEGTGLSYQWQRSSDTGATWRAIDGATASSLGVSGTALADNGAQYRVLVSATAAGSTATTTSAPATLRVRARAEPVAITAEPADASVTENTAASFFVTATGTSPSYQWQTRAPGAADFSDVAGATTPAFNIAAATLAQDALAVRVQVSNALGSVLSREARLSVSAATAAPLFVSQPANQSVVAPAPAAFAVFVSGNPAPSLQWQTSRDGGSTFTDIAGARASTFDTGATALADSGTLYRVVASNSAGTRTSQAATLSVTVAGTAPVFALSPLSETRQEDSDVTFVAVASGTPEPSYQWQISTDGLNYGNINGATSAIYTKRVVLADSGQRFRVIATNSFGTATSNVAILSVTARPTEGSGRVWSVGRQVDAGDVSIGALQAAEVDDSGRLTALLSQPVGTRTALLAVTGSPGARSASPDFGAPQAIDALAPHDPFQPAVLSVSPSGRAAAAWIAQAPCGGGSCDFVFVARRLASGSWGAPVRLARSRLPANLAVRGNDAGDVLVAHDAIDDSGTQATSAVAWWPSGTAAPQQRQWRPEPGADSLAAVRIALDGGGRFVVFGEGTSAAGRNADAVAYAGSMSSGIGMRETIDALDPAAAGLAAWGNEAGHMVLAWSQSSAAGVRATTRFATREPGAGSWTLHDSGVATRTGELATSTLSAQGDLIWHRPLVCRTLRRTAGVWQADRALPAGACAGGSGWRAQSVARNGDFLAMDGSGLWVSYQIATDSIVDSFTLANAGSRGYLLGLADDLRSMPIQLRLAPNGTAAALMTSTYETLPTATAAFTSRGITNLWGWFLR